MPMLCDKANGLPAARPVQPIPQNHYKQLLCRDGMSIPHAEVLFIQEITSAEDPIGKHVRTIGVIDTHDVPSGTCIISYKSSTLAIDVELIRSEIKEGSVYQVFGEINPVGLKVIPLDGSFAISV